MNTVLHKRHPESARESDVVRARCQALRPETEALFAALWQKPELPCLEYESSRLLSNWLERHGFAVGQGVGGIPTAFVARKGNGNGPRIAFLAEYDALPGLDNAIACERRPLGLRAGHACGHNHIGPANCGAAIAAAQAVGALALAGEVLVIGCPAEEILWGKIALLEKGVFEGIDIVLTAHGDYQTGALSRPCQSVVSGEFVFTGRAGHGGFAGASNALDGAELAIQIVDRIRAGQFADVSIKHVLRRAGHMPSITPDEVRVWFTTRNVSITRARQAYDMICRVCAEAAGLAGTQARHQFISESRGYLPNDTVGRVLFEALQQIGPPRWSEEHIAWMQQLVNGCAPGATMSLDRTVAYYDTGADYYGQDDGEVSWRIPLGRVNWAYPKEVPIHHWAWTALSGHAASYPGPLMAAESLATAALRLIAEPGLIRQAQDELRQRTNGMDIDRPRLGAWNTLTQAPETFWNATWAEPS